MVTRDRSLEARSRIVERMASVLLITACILPGLAAAHPEDEEVRWIIDAAVELQVEPEYPPRALAEGVQGAVRVGFTVDWMGGVEDPRILSAEPPGVFDAEVLRTIRHWRFRPAREPHTCRYHAQRAEQVFQFSIVDRAARVDLPPTLIEGVLAADRPVVRARTSAEIQAAIQRAKSPERPIPADGVKALYRKEPVFPRKAMIDGMSGRVNLRFTITEEGRVRDAEVLQSSPDSLFDQASLNALRHWKFKPRMVDGKPVASEACQQLSFKFQR